MNVKETIKKDLSVANAYKHMTFLVEEVGERLREHLKKIGKEDFFDKIATEENAEDPEKLVEYLTEIGHPALTMEAMF